MKIRKIAVLRASALGDFIFAIPALTALRETFPDAEICYMGKQWHKEFLAKRKSPVDRVIVVPPAAGVGSPEDRKNDDAELERFFKRMKREKFDVAIQLHGGGRHSNTFVRKLGAALTIGTKTPDADELDMTIRYEYYQSEYARLLEVVSLIGAHTVEIMPCINSSTYDEEEAGSVLGTDIGDIVILHPGASDMKRRWPPEMFAEVGDYFVTRGFRVIVTGYGNEEEIVKNVTKIMRNDADNFFGRLSLSGLAGLLLRASIMISNDTGPLHLADALGCKTVGIYWCGNLINAAPLFRNRSICLGSWTVRCPLCGEDTTTGYPFGENLSDCDHAVSYVSNITTDEVINAAEQLQSRKE